MDSTTKWLIGIAIVTIIFIYQVAHSVLLGIVIFGILLIYCWYSADQASSQLEIDRRLAQEKKKGLEPKKRGRKVKKEN